MGDQRVAALHWTQRQRQEDEEEQEEEEEEDAAERRRFPRWTVLATACFGCRGCHTLGDRRLVFIRRRKYAPSFAISVGFMVLRATISCALACVAA